MPVWSLGGEDPLEEGMATHSNILAWRILMDRGVWWATVHRVSKSQTWLKPLRTCTKPGETGQRKGYVSTLWFIWIFYWKKKCTMWELGVKFYLRQYEDCSLGDSTSHSSEKLLQRDGVAGGRGTVYMWFCQRESTCNQAHIFCRKFLLVSWSVY